MALAAMPDIGGLAGLPPRPGRQEPGPSQGRGHRHWRTIRDQAAPVLEQLAERNELSPSPYSPELRKRLTPASSPSRAWKVLGPVPDQGTLRRSRPIGPFDLDGHVRAPGASRRLEARPAGRRQGAGRPGQIYAHDDDLRRLRLRRDRQRSPTAPRRWPSARTTR